MAGKDWATMPFDQAVEMNPSVSLQRGVVYPFVDMQGIDPGSRSVYPSKLQKFKGGGSRFIAGDTLMARITPCLENGKIARYAPNGNQQMGHGSTEFIVIRGRPNVTDNSFAYYLTKWDGIRLYCISQMSGSSGRQRVPTNALAHYEVTIPPIKEQQAIACILGTLDDKIELNRRMNQTLEAMARAIFKSWFVDFDPVHTKAAGQQPPGLAPHIADLFPDAFEDSNLGEIPKGWRVCTINDIANLNARSLNRNDPLDVIDYIEINKVMRGEVSEITRYERGSEPSRARRRVSHGDTVLSTVRPDRGAYFLCLNPPETMIASTGFAVASSNSGSWAFLHAALTRLEIGEELGRQADGGAYPAVRPEVIGGLAMVVPQDQRIIDAFERVARPLFQKADRNRDNARVLAALRDALLPMLVSGSLQVSDADSIIGRAL